MARFGMLCALALATGACFASPSDGSSRYIGTGPACAGTLELRPAAISWTTAASTCSATPYVILDGFHDRTRTSVAYELSNVSQQCKFRVIALVQRLSGSAPPAWEAKGYGTAESYWVDRRSGFNAGKAGVVSCPVRQSEE